jgi:rhodanese-related sulfurtransferase
MSECQQLTAQELKQLYDQVTIIDIREIHEYDEEHIPNAINIPLSEMSKDKISKIDKNKPVVFHCHMGGRTTRATPQFLELGLENVCVLNGGIDAWKAIGGETVNEGV